MHGGSIYGENVLIFVDIQGKLYVRGDSKIFRFQNGKSESLFLQRKNPRRISWTILYRRQHRKGISEVSILPSKYELFVILGHGRIEMTLVADVIHGNKSPWGHRIFREPTTTTTDGYECILTE
jgi:ribosomal protein L24E